jgi:hypothetical protein
MRHCQVNGNLGDQVSRMSSLPANTSTPAARSISSGGMVSPPAPWVTSATPASAIVSAASAAFRSVTPPRQKPCRAAIALPLRVAGNFQRIDAANQIGAVANGRVEQVKDARTAHHAALRERNDLHRPITVTLASREHPSQRREAAFENDVDVGAQMASAVRDAFAD